MNEVFGVGYSFSAFVENLMDVSGHATPVFARLVT